MWGYAPFRWNRSVPWILYTPWLDASFLSSLSWTQRQSCCVDDLCRKVTSQPFTQTQWTSSSDTQKLFQAACCKLGPPLNAATRLTDAVRAALLTRQLSSWQGPLGHLKSFSTLLGDEALQLRADVLAALSWMPHTPPQPTPLLPTSGSVADEFVLRSLRQQRCWGGAGISLRAPVKIGHPLR